MKSKIWSAVLILAALGGTGVSEQAAAQGVSVTPLIGGYVPGGSFHDLQNAAKEKYERGATLGLGANIELGFLRGSIAYASGASISREGLTGKSEVGDGSVLVGAVDFVLRPIPKLIIVQPYLLGGAGYKKENYSFDQQGVSGIDDGDKDFIVHAGVGLDVSLGPISLVGEITDFIGRDNNDDWKVHDGFAMVGLKLRLF